jgi:hypothetical protein
MILRNEQKLESDARSNPKNQDSNYLNDYFNFRNVSYSSPFSILKSAESIISE